MIKKQYRIMNKKEFEDYYGDDGDWDLSFPYGKVLGDEEFEILLHLKYVYVEERPICFEHLVEIKREYRFLTLEEYEKKYQQNDWAIQNSWTGWGKVLEKDCLQSYLDGAYHMKMYNRFIRRVDIVEVEEFPDWRKVRLMTEDEMRGAVEIHNWDKNNINGFRVEQLKDDYFGKKARGVTKKGEYIIENFSFDLKYCVIIKDMITDKPLPEKTVGWYEFDVEDNSEEVVKVIAPLSEVEEFPDWQNVRLMTELEMKEKMPNFFYIICSTMNQKNLLGSKALGKANGKYKFWANFQFGIKYCVVEKPKKKKSEIPVYEEYRERPESCYCHATIPPCSFCTDANYCKKCDTLVWGDVDCPKCDKKKQKEHLKEKYKDRVKKSLRQTFLKETFEEIKIMLNGQMEPHLKVKAILNFIDHREELMFERCK